MRFRFQIVTLLMLILSGLLLTAPPASADQMILSSGLFKGESIEVVPTWYLRALRGDVTNDGVTWGGLSGANQTKVTNELTRRTSGTTDGATYTGTVYADSLATQDATTAGAAGDNLTVITGAGAANTGSSAGGAGGNLIVTASAGGAVVTGTGGAGGDITLTASAGGAASGAGTGGAGGTITFAPGAGGTTSGGTAGVTGVVKIGGAAGAAPLLLNLVRSTVTNAATISDAQIIGGMLYQDASGGNVTMTTRTGAQMDTAFPDAVTGSAIVIRCASNHATNTSTISGGSNVTLVGSGAVTQLGGTFVLIKTGSGTWDLVRVG